MPGMEWVADEFLLGEEDGTAPFCFEDCKILGLKGALEDQLRSISFIFLKLTKKYKAILIVF